MTLSFETRDIMGVRVTAARAGEVIAWLDGALSRGERIKLGFLNAHTSNLAAADPAFRAVLDGFTILNDGVGVDIASRRLYGARFPENLNGTDFTPRLLAGIARPLRLYLLGAQPGVAAAAAARIAAIAPQHPIVGIRDGYFPAGERGAVAAAVAAQKPDILLVAMGNPAQEMFIAERFDELACGLAIGVGALFDFLAGRVARAPRWMQRVRLEWLYRLWLEPGRLWRRYLLGNSQFLWRLLRTPKSRATPR